MTDELKGVLPRLKVLGFTPFERPVLLFGKFAWKVTDRDKKNMYVSSMGVPLHEMRFDTLTEFTLRGDHYTAHGKVGRNTFTITYSQDGTCALTLTVLDATKTLDASTAR